MRHVWAIILTIGLLLALPAQAQDTTAIRSVIQSQLDAFQRDDAPGAFALASPDIQGLFGSPERFLSMVRMGYPPVYRARRATFQELAHIGPTLIQPVLIVGADGGMVLALYAMEQQPDGSWRIDGCELRELPSAGV